ncbi:type II toxin-antitoxin system RelE family toxin [Legionella septentrionalis]|uniref:type II toxin-antitoxin system RelE family toxin n=1 Tax=Legionella septentrionalis TaxID=2498109 RepID=UPI000F8EA85E|nr:cytotoxic translational repressor of toxin-antitoxin stability system [Legionella septentrionalis]RUQ94603.1 cytotoxic translational repressor of toxin-antitoxin stability system [Legionella septentrionalis]RUR08670.1 cytotoxic translational repressor of toxin-antitoxin stability system [Legionella septentrionalis]
MNWTIKITSKAAKQVNKLPKSVKATLLLLLRDIERNGPATGSGWKNYGKFKGMIGDKRHCHLTKGKPTYVCCWEVVDKQIKLIEVYYVGTHEKAPY